MAKLVITASQVARVKMLTTLGKNTCYKATQAQMGGQERKGRQEIRVLKGNLGTW